MSKPHYHVAAGLIWRNGRVLLTKRPEGTHLAGYWEFPGGKQESGETIEVCLEREIREELGMEVRTGTPLAVVHHEYEAKTVTLHVFHCTHVAGRPLPLENQETRWVRPEDLRKYTFPPPDLEILEMIS